METRANYVMVGTFVLVVLIGIFIAILWLGHTQFNRQFSYYDIYFSGSVTGLNEGATVNYNGVSIGHVVDIRLDPQNPEVVRVTVEIDSSVPLKSDTVASLEITGITGVAYVEISGGSREAPPLQRQEGQRYPVIASRPSQLQSVVASAPEVLNRLILVADRLAELLDERNRGAISDTLQNMKQLTSVGVHDAQKLDQVLDGGDAALRSANEALVELRETLAAAKGVTGDMSATLHELNTTTAHLDTVIQELRPGLHDFSQSGFNELRQLLSDTRVLVAGLTRIASELERDPARFLFGDHREGYKPR